MDARFLFTLLCLLLQVSLSTGEEVRRWAIDLEREEFNTEMNVAVIDSRIAVAAWKAYHAGKETIYARRLSLDGKSAGEIQDLSGEGVFSYLQSGGAFNGEHFGYRWWGYREGRWIQENGAVRVSGPADSKRRLELAWSRPLEQAPLPMRWTESYERDRVTVRFRSARAGAWRFWDEYEEGRQRIVASQDGEEFLQVSPEEQGVRCLQPVAIQSQGEGTCVAWIKLTDVMGGEGVIDMIHTAHLATVSPAGDVTMVVDGSGSDEAAVFLNGLLPDLRPKMGYPSGYSGNRRHPMLLDSPEGVWLLWERKSKHSGGGTKTAGQLLGRRMQDGKWVTPPLLVHEGLIDYRLAEPERVIDGGSNFYVIGSEIPRGWKRPSWLVEVDLSEAKTVELDDWRDQYEEIELPFPEEEERFRVSGPDGKRYQLFWGDLHCHSGLTGDAEGEPDEIVLYARDRAKLDVMVLQDNDEVHGRILSEGEYRLGQTISQWVTERGRFVALPGYEWTQRTMKGGVPDPFAPVYEQSLKRSYPNHRTVIYPMKGGPIVRYFEVGHDFDKMAEAVAEAGGILHSQHPAFDLSDHPNEANLEVTACWGIYIRSVPALFHGELDKGRRMGFIGTSDSHRRNPGLCGGLTGIYAEELTPEAIFEALVEHRVFATNGSKIVIESRVNGTLSDRVTRSEDGNVSLSLFVRGTSPVKKVRLIGTGGRTVANYEGNGTRELRIERELSGLSPGDHWFYWAIEQEGTSRQYTGNISVARGNLAWSSPHFVEVEEYEE